MLDDNSPRRRASNGAGARTSRLDRRPPFECIALLLQGGRALGSYQAGVYEAHAEAALHPDWVAGISIGAINAAIIAGNPKAERVSKLRAFWEGVSANPWLDWTFASEQLTPRGDVARSLFSQLSAAPEVVSRRRPALQHLLYMAKGWQAGAKHCVLLAAFARRSAGNCDASAPDRRTRSRGARRDRAGTAMMLRSARVLVPRSMAMLRRARHIKRPARLEPRRPF